MSIVYSIGHSNHTIESFLSLLNNYKITCLIDIRSVPFSRFYPQYNQNALMQELNRKCIKYIYLGNELGGRITDTTCYKDHIIPTSKVGYATFLDYNVIKTKEWFLSGIHKLYSLVDLDTCVVMCSEENPDKCHRELIIGRKIKEDGYSLIHIRTNNERTSQLPLFS